MWSSRGSLIDNVWATLNHTDIASYRLESLVKIYKIDSFEWSRIWRNKNWKDMHRFADTKSEKERLWFFIPFLVE